MELTIDDAIRLFIELRDKEAVIKAEADAKINGMKEARQKLSAYLKERADEQGIKQFKTANGTAFWKAIDFAQVQAWDETLDFIKRNEYWDMLEHSVSKKAVRAYINEHKQVPPGVNFGSRLELNVRRASVKEEE